MVAFSHTGGELEIHASGECPGSGANGLAAAKVLTGRMCRSQTIPVPPGWGGCQAYNTPLSAKEVVEPLPTIT